MKINRLMIVMTGMVILGIWGLNAYALKAPHTTTASYNVYCKNCHIHPGVTPPGFYALTSFNNMCFNAQSGCHVSNPGTNPDASKKRFTRTDASNRFKNVPRDSYYATYSTSKKQSSHGWKIPNTNADAGATNNWAPMREYGDSRYLNLKNKIYCTRCHRAHGDTGPNGEVIYRSFFKADPTGDYLCFQCHASRRIGDVTNTNVRGSLPSTISFAGSQGETITVPPHYSHPVEVNYSSARSKSGKSTLFFRNPTSLYPSNPSAKLKLYTTKGGVRGAVVCSTCHGPIHASDSNPYTFDSLSTYSRTNNYSSSAGNLLRLYPMSKSDDICTSCHKVTTHRTYKCNRCHAPHKKAGENNRYLILENISTPYSGKRKVVFTAFSQMADRWTSDGEADGKSNAMCQVCHTGTEIPTLKYHRNYSTNAASRMHYNESGSKYSYCPTCHIHSAGFSPSGEFACGACHKAPPSDTFGKHTKHTGSGAAVSTYKWDTADLTDKRTTTNYGFSCGRCHSKWAPYTSKNNYPNHRPTSTFNDDTYGIYTADIGFKVLSTLTVDPASSRQPLLNPAGTYGYGTRGTPMDFGNNSTAGTSGSWFSRPASGGGTCQNLYCHGQFFNGYTSNDPNWLGGTAQTCGACHGVAQELGKGIPGKTGSISYGAHQRHVGSGTQEYGQLQPRFRCNACHYASAPLNNATSLNKNNHVNGRTNVKFDPAYESGATNYGGFNSYSGKTNRSAKTPKTVYKTCSLTYCHSDGSRLQGNYSAGNQALAFRQPNWSSVGNFTTTVSSTKRRCSRCHGGDRTPGTAFTGITASMPGYNSRAGKGNSHYKHVVENGFLCRVCHSKTVNTDNKSIYFTYSAHMNKRYDVDIVSSYGGTFNSGDHTCSSVKCHGGKITPPWGNTVTCQDCHVTTTGDTDKRILARSKFTGWTSAAPKVYSADWATRGHGRDSSTAYDKSGNMGAQKACTVCHGSGEQRAVGTKHGTSNNPFRLYTAPDRPNVVCNKCHGVGGSGATKKDILTHASSVTGDGHNYEIRCIDCHDPHGDNNIFMLHSTVSRPGTMARDVASGKYGIITSGGTISNVDFVSNVYTSDYALKSAAPKVCQVCHDETYKPSSTAGTRYRYNGSSDTKHGSAKCTSCHSHSKGFKGAGCDACHGNPPDGTKSILGGPSTTTSKPVSGAGSAGSHSKHITVYGNSATTCSMCHQGGMYDSGTENAKIDIGFKAFGSYTGSAQKYTGKSAVRTGNYGYAGNGITTGDTMRCQSMKCHGGGNWLTASYGTPTAPEWYTSSTAKCGKCHGAKKAAGQGSWPTTNAHAKHAGTGSGQYDFSCQLCHDSTVLTSWTTLKSSTHVNGFANFSFDISDSRVYAGSRYNGDTVINSGFGTCQNTYCHSRGTKTTAPYNNTTALSNYTAKWTDSPSNKCNYCHGSKTPWTGITSAMPLQSGQAHKIHVVDNGFSKCYICHANVVDVNNAISNKANHVNGFKNISIIKTYKSGQEGYSSTVASKKTCKNIKCHGGRVTPLWTSTGKCQDCHYSTASPEDSFTWQSFTGTAARIYSSDWMKRGHGKTKSSGRYPFSNNSGAGKACDNCHTKDVKHNQSNYFRLLTAVGVDSDKLCMRCHGSGTQLKSGFGRITGIQSHTWQNISTAGYNGGASGKADWNFTPKCIDCHDPHGDNNNAMIHRYVNMTGSDSAGRPAVPPAWTVNENAAVQVVYTAVGGSQMNWSSYVRLSAGTPYTGICQRCHSTGVDFFDKAQYGNPANSHNNGQRCTSCHKHKKGFAPSGCDSCHGATRGLGRADWSPPKGPSGWTDSLTNKSSVHQPHAYNPRNRAGFGNTTGFACQYCHDDSMPAGNHNTSKTGANMNNLTSSNGYGGRNSQSKFSYGTNSKAPADDTCWNTTCHTPRAYTRKWAKPANCDDCHGYTRTRGTINGKNARTFALQTTQSHKIHINWTGTINLPASWTKNYSFACSNCHYNVPTGNYTTHYSGQVNITSSGPVNTVGGAFYTRGRQFKGFTTGGEVTATSYCTKTYCHGNFTNGTTTTRPSWKKGATTLYCIGCHKAKTARVSAWTNGTTMPARHPKHVRTATYNFACSKCHVRTASNNTTVQFNWSSHVNGRVDVYFDSVSGVFNGSNKTCQSSYCHSRGSTQSAPYVTANYTAKWTDSNKGCSYCHGNKTMGGITAAMPASPVAGGLTHEKHAHNGANSFRCNVCHANVVNASGTIISFSNHVNKFKNISIISTYKTAGSNWNVGAKTCSAIKCHGGRTTPAWTASANCQDCHYGSTAEDNWTWQNYSGSAGMAQVYSSEWTRKGHAPYRTCTNCHTSSVKHNTGSNPFRLFTSDPDRLCAACHGSGTGEVGKWGAAFGSKTGIVTHSQSATNGDATWPSSFPNQKAKCVDCHDPHGDRNRSMIQTFINMSGSDTNGKPTATAQMIFTTAGANLMGWSSFVKSDYTKLCQRCHNTQTNMNHFNKAAKSGGGYDATHNLGKKCTTCHKHKEGFKGGGESTGGNDCGSCHSTLYQGMKNQSSFHHVMRRDTAIRPFPSRTDFAGTLSNFTSTHRRCLMCHVDHNNFSRLNGSSRQRAKNLRVDAWSNDTSGVATDFWPAKRKNAQRTGGDAGTANYSTTYPISGPAGKNGVCISCHNSIQYKNTTEQRNDGSSMARTFSVGLYTSSSHNYQVISGFNNFSGRSSFRANCTKCHNSSVIDRKGTEGQLNSRFMFGLHDAKNQALMSYSSIMSQKPKTEELCYKCHDSGVRAKYDFYSSVKMGSGAKTIKTAIVAKKSGHPVDSEAMAGLHKTDEYVNAAAGWNGGTNRHVECTDCHNTHGGNASILRRIAGPFYGRVLPDASYRNYSGGNKVAGSQAGAWGVSLTYGGGAGTSPTFTKTSQVKYQYELCIKCHSSYGYGASAPGVPSGLPDPAGRTAAPYDILDSTVAQADIAIMINPNNYGFHPIFQKGRNQPPKSANTNWPATKSNWMFFDKMTNRTGFISVSGLSWNFVPPWNQYSLLSCSDCHQADNTGQAIGRFKPSADPTTTGTWGATATKANIEKAEDGLYAQGTTASATIEADVTGSTGAPGTVNSTLVVAYGSSSASTANSRKQTLQAWNGTAYEGGTVTFAQSIARAEYTITNQTNWATIDSTYKVKLTTNGTAATVKVDYLGIESIYQAPGEVRGPHGSLERWITTDVDTTIRFDANNNNQMSDAADMPNSGFTGNAKKIFCWNCHRSDVYYNSGIGGGAATYPNYARLDHSSGTVAEPFDDPFTSTNIKNVWGIACFNCHAGGQAGAIHGTFQNSTTPSWWYPLGGSASRIKMSRPLGVRLLNGAGFAIDPATGTCYTPGKTESATTAAPYATGCSDAQHSAGGVTTTFNYTYTAW